MMRCPECGRKRGEQKRSRDIDNGTELNTVIRSYTCLHCKSNFQTYETWLPFGMDPVSGEYVEEIPHTT